MRKSLRTATVSTLALAGFLAATTFTTPASAGTARDEATPAQRAAGEGLRSKGSAPIAAREISRNLAGGVLYDNGSLVTHPGGGAGGADTSALQTALGMTIFGFGHQIASNNSVADDFTIPAGETWQIDTITFLGYQTGSTTTSTFNDVRVQIWDGPPNGGGTVVYGDLTTNRMATSTWSNAYRTLDTDLLNTQRPIMEVVATINTSLGEGTYWVQWTEGGTLASGPWAPPVSVLGQTGSGNALQNLAGTWGALLDTTFPQDLPFTIAGTASGAADCAVGGAPPDNNPAGIDSTITIDSADGVLDLDVQITGTHTWVGDVVLRLTHVETGTAVTFFDRPGRTTTGFGCSGDDFPGVFGDDEGTDGTFEDNCLNATPAYTPEGHYIGNNPLSAFDGESYDGDWTLNISDHAGGDTGTITEWCLVATTGPTTEPDIVVDPTDMTSTLPADQQETQVLTIENIGDADLTWEIFEAGNRPSNARPARAPGLRDLLHSRGVWLVPQVVEPLTANHTFSRAASGAAGRFAPIRPEVPAGTVTITHSTTQNIVAGSVSCNAGGLHTNNSYVRRFTLADFGITSDFNVEQVEVGVEQAIGAGGSQPVTVNLYTWNPSDPFTFASFVDIGTADATITDQSLTIVAIPVTGTAPAGSTLVVELFTPNGQTAGHSFFVGSNPDGQTDASFIAAADCGVAEPTDLAVIGFPNMHIVMNVSGVAGGGCGEDLTWVSVSPTSGTTTPASTSDVDVTFDSTGLNGGDVMVGSLCVDSNDPDSPSLLVPLTLNVDTMPFLDGFESGDTSEWSFILP